ncbi:hypothetical protein L1049_022502 [Liquidambar formosana]|uniref:Uncharacterized protein n=1 Tax=Liquidambar formosana TaxID=63359 RepID=A0AAP0RE11_LIQFO
MAGRALLVQFVTSAIPAYTMQTCKIPMSICDKVDRTNRKFIWGNSDNRSRVHLVVWDKVCRPKSLGGLGIQSMGAVNISYMARMGWKLITEPNALWANILIGKYLKDKSFMDYIASGQESYSWKCILKGKEVIKAGFKWVLGNGSKIKFWLDLWVGDDILSDISLLPMPEEELNTLIEDYIDGSGN